MNFAIHLADLFEGYLILLQSSKPVIHIIYSAIGDLLFSIMSSFVKLTCLTTDTRKVRKDAQALGAVNVEETQNLLSIHKIDYGKAALREIGSLESKTNLDAVKTEIKLCYQDVTLYLQKNLPYKLSILKDLQFFHKTNRLKEVSVLAVRRVATKVAEVLHGTNLTDLNKDRYADEIVRQFKLYQTEDINLDEELDSYSFWRMIGGMKDQQNHLKFDDLSKLARTCLTLCHGNAAPERGFSFNSTMLQNREETKEDTIIAIRIVKDAILHYGKVEDFPITRRLLDLCASSRQKYFLHLEVEKQQREFSERQKQKEIENAEAQKQIKEKLSEVQSLENQIEEETLKLAVADNLIEEGTGSLSSLLLTNGALNKSSVMKAQMLISAGVEKSKTTNSNIKNLKLKMKNILKK
ncbi:hypothetical protein Bhyg_04336 [Pseudolycoriella hygida]|uniref:HAT C-terminal dimerisation domain-containing protein n=1 Tax=Pseudolycoriella hygida TaxID=35572 RepID=A0A9Q0S9I3_9DIPT|nr:hypothetical protein Bhyg_04336 [Pseudolycoriella hygida]